MKSRQQYLQKLQKEYLRATRIENATLLDEAEKQTDLKRKYLIRKLSPKTNWVKQPMAAGTRFREFGSDLIIHLVTL